MIYYYRTSLSDMINGNAVMKNLLNSKRTSTRDLINLLSLAFSSSNLNFSLDLFISYSGSTINSISFSRKVVSIALQSSLSCFSSKFLKLSIIFSSLALVNLFLLFPASQMKKFMQYWTNYNNSIECGTFKSDFQIKAFFSVWY